MAITRSPNRYDPGPPNGAGGFATLPVPVSMFSHYDDATLQDSHALFPVALMPFPTGAIRAGECTTFSGTWAECENGADFPTMAIDKAGNLYVVWATGVQ